MIEALVTSSQAYHLTTTACCRNPLNRLIFRPLRLFFLSWEFSKTFLH